MPSAPPTLGGVFVLLQGHTGHIEHTAIAHLQFLFSAFRFPLSPVAIAIAIAISSFFLLSLGSRIKFSVPALAFTDFS